MKRLGLRRVLFFAVFFILFIAFPNSDHAKGNCRLEDIPASFREDKTVMAYALDQKGQIVDDYLIYDPSETLQSFFMAERYDGNRLILVYMDSDTWPVGFFKDREKENKYSEMRYNGAAWSFYGRRVFYAGTVNGVVAGINPNGIASAIAKDAENQGKLVNLVHAGLEAMNLPPIEESETGVLESEQEEMPTGRPDSDRSLVTPLVAGGAAVGILLFLLLQRKNHHDE